MTNNYMKVHYATNFTLPLTGIDLRKAMRTLDMNPNKYDEDRLRKVIMTLIDGREGDTISLVEIDLITRAILPYVYK